MQEAKQLIPLQHSDVWLALKDASLLLMDFLNGSTQKTLLLEKNPLQEKKKQPYFFTVPSSYPKPDLSQFKKSTPDVETSTETSTQTSTPWVCEACTFADNSPTAFTCKLCQTPRSRPPTSDCKSQADSKDKPDHDSNDATSSDEKKDDDEGGAPLMYLAGLYDVWVNKETNEKTYSVTILTTSAAQDIGWIHDRMPVILVGEGITKWLDKNTYNFEQCRSLLLPFKGLKWCAVSDSVSNVRNHGPECIEPMEKAIERQKKAGIQKFFQPITKTSSTSKTQPNQTIPTPKPTDTSKPTDTPTEESSDGSKKPTAASRKRKSPPPPT